MATSNLQEQTKKRLRLLLSKYRFIENYRPDWLKNPETGSNLELDFWLPKADIGIEVQGRQHIEFTPYFHNTIEDFEAQCYRDGLKKVLCQKRGVALYEIFCPDDIDGLIEELIKYNEESFEVLFGRNLAVKALGFFAAELARLPKKPKTFRESRIVADRYDSLLQRMIKIAEANEIPLTAVEPDFTIRKVELTFFNKPIVKVRLFNLDGEIVNSARAGIMSKEGDIARIAWYSRSRGKAHYHDIEFDMTTGWQLGEVADGCRWQVNLDTVPEDSEIDRVVKPGKAGVSDFEVGQQVIWHHIPKKGKEYDFDFPVEGTIIQLSKRKAQILIKTKSGTPYYHWARYKELEA